MDMPRAIFVFEPESDPYFNMACDNALFSVLSRRSAEVTAILRLYSWKIPAITIGYNQDVSKALDLTRVEDGLPVIRRITGGRAIYHDRSEITFSLTARMDRLPMGPKGLGEMKRG